MVERTNRISGGKFLGCSNFPACRYTYNFEGNRYNEPPPEKQAQQQKSRVATGDWIPNCPDCGEPMLLKENRTSGKQFWGCRDYPECSGILEVSWPQPTKLIFDEGM